MQVEFISKLRGIAGIALFSSIIGPASADPQHGIAMYGDPALPHDFVSLPYVNADAPTGGQIVTAEVGSFDSLNPFIRKGSVPWQLRFFIGESLMGRSLDEPFSLYGVLAESIETGPNREWVEFTLREGTTFSDGSPLTIEDVMWSYETLGTVGHPRYQGFWVKVETMEQTGDRSIRFTFNVEDRELALLAGLRPILKKSQWEGIAIEDSTVEIVPITSSPYMIDDFEAGRFVSLRRNPDYWGKDVQFRRGTNNIDEVRLEFFGDETAAFEAFKVGEVNSTRENNVARWESQYNFPAIENGDVVLSVLPHERPSGMTGFVMNTRRDQFSDWRVRDAMMHAFNFEFINEAMTGSAQPRITSYWSNSPLGMSHEPAKAGSQSCLNHSPLICHWVPSKVITCQLATDQNVTVPELLRRWHSLRQQVGPFRTACLKTMRVKLSHSKSCWTKARRKTKRSSTCTSNRWRDYSICGCRRQCTIQRTYRCV